MLFDSNRLTDDMLDASLYNIPLIVFVVEFAVADGKQTIVDFSQLTVCLFGLDTILDSQTSKRQQFLQDIDVHIVSDEFFGNVEVRGVRTPAFDDVITAGINAIFGDEFLQHVRLSIDRCTATYV